MCPLECKGMVPAANPPLPAGGQLMGSHLQLKSLQIAPTVGHSLAHQKMLQPAQTCLSSLGEHLM